MANEETQILDYHEKNNRFWWHPEYMEDYWLKNGYEWRDGLLQPKIDPRSLNDGGIPTNDYNMPAQPGLNMMPLNARLQTMNRGLDQTVTKWCLLVEWGAEWRNLQYFSPKFKEKLSFEDVKDLVGFSLPGFQISEEYLRDTYVNTFNQEKYWNPSWRVIDGNIVITQWWSYIVQYYCDFFYTAWHDTKEAQKLWLSLSVDWVDWMISTQRACMSRDAVQGTYIGYLEHWYKLNVKIAHTFEGETVLCCPSLNIVRIR